MRSVSCTSIIHKWTVSTFHYESKQVISREYKNFDWIANKRIAGSNVEKACQTGEGVLCVWECRREKRVGE